MMYAWWTLCRDLIIIKGELFLMMYVCGGHYKEIYLIFFEKKWVRFSILIDWIGS